MQRNHGLHIGAPVSEELNKTNCAVSSNTIEHCRAAGILVVRPNQPESAGVTLSDNRLVDTGEDRFVVSVPGECSRNRTGQRFELQAFWRCSTCQMLPSNNLGCCTACAQVCHKAKGHTGVYEWGLVGAYCDCNEVEGQDCCIFKGDPPLKDEPPEEVLLERKERKTKGK